MNYKELEKNNTFDNSAELDITKEWVDYKTNVERIKNETSEWFDESELIYRFSKNNNEHTEINIKIENLNKKLYNLEKCTEDSFSDISCRINLLEEKLYKDIYDELSIFKSTMLSLGDIKERERNFFVRSGIPFKFIPEFKHLN